MEIDPRGPRFGAVITTVVLAVVLITGSAWLLAAQVAVFAVGALAGLRYAPYGLLYRRLVRPRLGPPAHTEAEAPPRFSQAMGMVIAGVGLICLAVGATRPAWSSPRSRWPRRSSTRPSICAWAAIFTCSFSGIKGSGRPLRTRPEKEVYPQ